MVVTGSTNFEHHAVFLLSIDIFNLDWQVQGVLSLFKGVELNIHVLCFSRLECSSGVQNLEDRVFVVVTV
jgi:hypothetical protein